MILSKSNANFRKKKEIKKCFSPCFFQFYYYYLFFNKLNEFKVVD